MLSFRSASFFFAAITVVSSAAQAGAWTRDQGHFYVNTSYSRIAASSVFGPNFGMTTKIDRYEQQIWGFYGEVGIISRWLTATLESTLFRWNEQSGDHTDGVGDWRVGLWTGLLTQPVRLSFGLSLGIPLGRPTVAQVAGQTGAQALPVGDGEWDVEGRLALGYSFGGVRRWPLVHYLVVEAGYWKRTAGFADSFVYKLEVGVKLPWTFIERFWFIGRFAGVESFAATGDVSLSPTGLGNGFTVSSPSVEVYGRIFRGLGASVGADSAFRARAVAAGAQLRATISYQW